MDERGELPKHVAEAFELMESRRHVLGAMVTGAALALTPQVPAFAATTKWDGPVRPRFAPALGELKLKLPPGKMAGQIVAVTRSPITGDIFILQFPERADIQVPAPARLPWIVRVDSRGNFVGAWGGPDYAPTIDGVNQWPIDIENVEADAEGNIWVCGWGRDDDAVLCYSPEGKLLKRFGQRGKAGTDEDTSGLLNSPPSVYHDVKTRELFVADGYGNHRVISFNSDTGKFIRVWGAYGKPPQSFTYGQGRGAPAAYGAAPGAGPREEGWANPVHKVTKAPDGKILVSSRPQNKVQEFELTADGVRFIREVLIAPGSQGLGTASDIAVTPDNKWMYVLDMSTQRVWIIDRPAFKVVGWVNAAPQPEGTDLSAIVRRSVHRMQLMPNGDILIARTILGLNYLKFVGVH